MKWVKTEDQLPRQGTKVLWWKNGDCWVAWRFGEHWFPTIFLDSRLAVRCAPEMWAYIRYPKGFSGKVRMTVDEAVYDMDSLEKCHPAIFRDFVDEMIKTMDSR